MTNLLSAEHIEKQYQGYKAMTKVALYEVYKLQHKVHLSSYEGTKTDLIFDILRNEHGQKRLEAWIAEFHPRWK